MVGKIPLYIQKNIKVKGERVGDYFYDRVEDAIYYDLPYPWPFHCTFKVVSMNRIYATPAMVKLPSFLKYHNIDWLRQQIQQIYLISSDMIMLHGAAWRHKDGIGHLAVGFPNCGKTTRVLREMQRSSTQYCSDENVIVDASDMIMYPVERSTSLNPWIAKEIKYPLTLKQKIDFGIAKVKAKMLPIFEPNIWVDLPYKRLSFKLDAIHFLTPGKGRSLRLLTDNEFPWFTNPVIQTWAYATGVSLGYIYFKYSDIIRRIENATVDLDT